MEFMPHGHCYFWLPELLWLHFVTDLLIGIAYVSISLTLWYLVRRIRLPFHGMFFAFGIFIAACGGTHFMAVWNIWEPDYWAAGAVKAVTAIASIATGILLFPLMPKVESLVRSAELAESRRLELAEKNRELETLYLRVKDVDVAKTEFFANVSHELRTPLGLILGPTENLLARGELAADQRRDLEVVARNARTLLKHVNDLLEVARVDAGRSSLEYAATDLPVLVRMAAAHFEALATERGLSLEVETPRALAAEVDPDKLERVLINLLSNAFKATPAGGTVRCALREEGGKATIEVADSGPGVSPDRRQQIFERFRLGDQRQGGIGLGLAIVKDFVELHGGAVSVGESPEGGALFRAVLPLRAPAGTPVRAATAPAASDVARTAVEALRAVPELAPTVTGDPDRPQVLVVEDNPDLRSFLVSSLAADHGVTTAVDGVEGLEKALERRPDIILSDVMMPRMGGDELVRAIRKHAELDSVPIVLLTARADDQLRIRMLREGAQDYLLKPFSVEELLVRIGNLLAMKRTRELLQLELASQVQGLESLAREVSFRKRELQTALAETRIAREQAELASQAKSNFLALVSHELRTPLTSIELYLEALQRGTGLAPRQAEIVGKIGVSATRLLELIDSLLEYVRIESGRLVVRRENVRLESVAASAVEELLPQASLKGLELRLREAPPLPDLVTDGHLLRLVLLNLIGNAIKYTAEGEVEVTLRADDGGAAFSVRDTGAGILPDQLPRIFEPFQQLEPIAHKHQPGFGLGLSLVRSMVEALHGRIEVRSVGGKGSTFTVFLPQRV